MTLDEEIQFWTDATDKASSKEIALVAFGIQWGLRIARDEHLSTMKESRNENDASVDPR